jgi:hypothetical protein
VDDLERPSVVALAAMRVIERARGLRRDPHTQRQRQVLGRRAVRERAREVGAVHVLHRDEVGAVGLSEIEDLDDVRVGQARRDLRLADEELCEARPCCERGKHALDDDGLLEPGGASRSRAPHLRHPAFGDAIEELVVSDARPFRHRGRYIRSLDPPSARTSVQRPSPMRVQRRACQCIRARAR